MNDPGIGQQSPVLPELSAAPFITASYKLLATPKLCTLLGAEVLGCWHKRAGIAYRGLLAWAEPSVVSVLAFAKQQPLPLWRVHDGFLRSVAITDPPLSLVIDDLGIYFDATQPSRLEALIAATHTQAQQSRAQQLIAAWRTARVSQYNAAREYTAPLPSRYVLVVDQAQGQAAIQYGLADKHSFQHMLAAALQENPDCTVLLKLPEHKRGHFDLDTLANDDRVAVLAEEGHPVTLLEHAEALYCVTSPLGFEGLLWGKKVRTFGMPFYAGWGLTDDNLPAPKRRIPVPLANLVYAVLVAYPRYIDPETGKRCEVEQLLTWLGLQRRMRMRFPEAVYAHGFSAHKKTVVQRFFQGSTVVFKNNPYAIPKGALAVVWGQAVAMADGQDIVRLEDGFIRSVGLGADLVRPLSLAMDTRGIYYDATRPSDLEQILQHSDFDAALTARAQALRERLVAEGLTKYNVGAAQWQRPRTWSLSGPDKAQPVILVPGQVETDASLAFGAPGIRKNLDLLTAVRTAHPSAYIVYKPHPDVVAGLRGQGEGEDEAGRWCDETVTDVAMGLLLGEVDEVHTLTSLAGFEALLRGKKVVCYGLPFYAGWGLTEDRIPLARRTRRLTLDELVAGVLVLYPTYVSRTTHQYTTPERALDELLAWRQSTTATPPIWRRGLRWLLQMESALKLFFAKRW